MSVLRKFESNFLFFFSLVTTNALLIWPTLANTENLNSQLKSCSKPKINAVGKVFLFSFASIIVPSGYSNDEKMLHPKIKGGVYLILNNLVTMIAMGTSLAFTMKGKMPKIVSNIPIPQSPMKIEYSESCGKIHLGPISVFKCVEKNLVSKSKKL